MKDLPVSSWLLGMFAMPLLVLAVSCNDDTVVAPPEDPPDFSTPEGIVEALGVSYRTRDIDLYAELLAADFRFQFQPIEQASHGEYWTADQDTTGTAALFRTPLVSTIRIDLFHGPAEDPEAGFDPDVRKIHLTHVQLEVDQTDGTTLLVTNLQDLYFRPGRELPGEDSGRWYLLEWRELPRTFSPRPMVQGGSWGILKSLYLSEGPLDVSTGLRFSLGGADGGASGLRPFMRVGNDGSVEAGPSPGSG